MGEIMTLQQPGTGYRAPAKAMTIKALQDRAKKAAEFASASTQIQGPIADPLQGISHLTGVLSGQVQQGRADAAEADARSQLAGIMAGIDPVKGATMQQLAAMQQLDPDFANKEYERMMTARADAAKQEDQQSFLSGESTLERQARVAEQNARFGHEDASAATKVTTDENAAISADQRADQNAIDKAKLDADEKMRQEAAAAEEQKRQEAAAADVGPETASREAEWKRLNPGGDINSPEAQAYILRNAAETTGGFGGPAGLKAMQDWQHEGNMYTTGLNDINEAKSLVSSALTGTVGKKIAEWAGSLGETGIAAAVAASEYGGPGSSLIPAEFKGITRDQIMATQRLYAIMDKISNLQMSGTLKGTSTDREMANFQRIFADPAATPEMKMTALASLEQSFAMERQNISNTITTAGGQALSPYEYKPVNPAAPGLKVEEIEVP